MVEEANLSTDGHTRRGSLPDLILVDDDPLITDSLAFVLQSDYCVHVSQTRQEAKSLLQRLRETPSLALVDLGRLESRGFETIADLHEVNPNTQIIAMSGMIGGKLQQATEYGAAATLRKPFAFRKMNELVQRLVKETASVRE